MGMAVVTLKKGEGRLLKSGGMWIFDNEIDTVMGNFENGDIVLVHDFDGYPMGRGFINTNSKITVRLMTRDENVDINEELLEKRVRDAWEYRKKVVDTGCCRLIFAEADFLPGIVVDKFSDVLVVQSLALGIDRFKETIVELLQESPGRRWHHYSRCLREKRCEGAANRKEWKWLRVLSRTRVYQHLCRLKKMA